MKAAVLFVVLVACLPAFLSADGAPSLRAALLAWKPAPMRPDVQRVAAGLVALAQAELSAEPGIEWVERAELDKLLAETDLTASGHLDPRASLRLGKLARAQLLVTGRLAAADFAKTTLALEVVDLERGDLLASSVTPLPPRPHKHYALRDEDRAATVAALRALLAEASAKHRALADKPALALLFLANSGPSSRLDAAGARLADSLRESAAAAGGRVLQFPRARDAEAEQELAILGLAEADDQAWRGVADLYVWGEYKESPADGLPFEQIPVESSLTLWDGASAPRTIPWRGTVATFPEAQAAFAAALAPAMRRTPASDPAARATAAKLLNDQAAALEKLNTAQAKNRAFWESELGRNFQRHQIRLLETALFLDPSAIAPRKALCDIRWHSLSAPKGGFSVEQLWNRYDDLVALAARRSSPRSGMLSDVDVETRIHLLQDIIRAHGARLRGEGRLAYPRILRAADRWVHEVKTHAAALAAQPGFRSKDLERFGESRLHAVAGDGPIGQPEIDATVVGNHVLHRMIDGTWLVLAPAFAAQFKEDPDVATVSASRILEVFRSVGQEDIAYARLSEAIADRSSSSFAANHPGASPTIRTIPSSPPIDPDTLHETAKELVDSLPVKLVQTGARSSSSNGNTTFSMDLRAPFGTSATDCDRIGAELRTRLLAQIPGLSEASIRVVPDTRAPPALTEFGLPPDPPPVAPDWKSRDAEAVATTATSSPAKSGLDHPLPLSAHPLHVWFYAGDFASDLAKRAYKQWHQKRLSAPDLTRLLGFDGNHLWIDGLPVEGAIGEEAGPYRVTAYSPYSRTFTGLTSRLPQGSRLFAGQFTPELGFLASEFDGLLELGAGSGAVRRITTDQGLPSLKLSALARYDNGIAVAATPPERTAAYLEFSSHQWRALQPPPAPRVLRPGASHDTAPAPVLAGAGRWLLYADTHPSLFDTATQRWSDALADHQAKRAALHERVREEFTQRFHAASASGDTAALASIGARRRDFPDWALDAPAAAIADGRVFWLGGAYGLTRLDPESPATAVTEKCPPILAMADAGPWLWVAFAPPEDSAPPKRPGFFPAAQGKSARPHAAPYPTDEPPEWRRSRLALYDKAARRWLGSLEVEGGIVSLAAAPGRLWAAGSDLYEFDTTALPAPASAPAPATGFTSRWAALPDHPLHRAVALHDHAALDALLASSPSVALDRAVSGWTPLHAAAAAGNHQAVAALLTAAPFAVKEAVNAFTAEGLSPLAFAAGVGDLASLRLLLKAGADPSAQGDAPPAPEVAAFGKSPAELPAVSPPQPDTTTATLREDGTIRIAWTTAPGPFDGFVIYRDEVGRTHNPHGVIRWDRGGSDNLTKWDFVGRAVATVGPSTRAWIDRESRAAAVDYRYTVIAVNPHDRYGPRTPAVSAMISAPAMRPPVARLYATSPARFSASPLHLAASSGRVAAVATLLDAGADSARRDLGGYTPHHAALLAGHTDAARVLLTRGAPLNAVVPAPRSSSPDVATVHAFQRPLHPALHGERPVWGAGTALSLIYEASQDRELLETILAAGADPLLGPDGPLAVRAAYLGRKEDAERFLALAPHPFVTDIYDRTAFVAALAAKRFAFARELRERCFAPRDPRWPAAKSLRLNETALKLAAEHGDHEMLGWLIAQGASLPIPYGWDDLLKIAVEKSHVDCVGHLIAAGAQPHSIPSELRDKIRDPRLIAALEAKPAPKGPLLPAARAVASSVPKTTPPPPPAPTSAPSLTPPVPKPALPYPRRLYSPSALYSPPPDNVWVQAPGTVAQAAADQALLAAAGRGDLNALKAALDQGARVNTADEKRWTPLIHAIQHGHREAARILIDQGASLNWLTRHGSSPVGFSTGLPDLGFARELLDLGADPNLTDGDLHGSSPLVTCMTKRPAAAGLLLERGADPRVVTNSQGRGGALPPVFMAAARGDLAAIKKLVAAGAEPAAVLWRDGRDGGPARGQTALHSAASSNDIATLDYFLALGLDPAQADGFGDNALDMALIANADHTATKLRALGVKTRAERGLSLHEF